MPPRRREDGMTLVEVLVALAIFATVLVIIMSSFRGAAQTREILRGRSDSFRQIRIALDRIGSDVSGAFASEALEQTALSCREDEFSGKPAATLIFTAFSHPDDAGVRPAAGIIKIKYFPKLSADGRFVDIYREQSDLPLIENKIPTRESRLAGRLLGFRVELFDGKTWVREWPAADARKNALPQKVAIVLTDALGEEYRRVVPVPLAGQEAHLPFSGKRSMP
jgi:general secretion pathway protein J